LVLVIVWFAHRYRLPYDQWDVTWKNALLRGTFLIAFTGALLARSWVAPAFPHVMFPLLLLGIHGGDILTHAPSQNPTIPVALFAPGVASNSFPGTAPKHGEARAMISPSADQALANNTVRDFSEQFIGKRLALWSNLNLLDHVPKVNGSSTLQLREQMQVQKRLYAVTNDAPAGLLDFLGVSWITAPGRIVEWTTREGALPLVTIGPKPLFVDSTNTSERIFSADFNPRAQVYLPLEAEPFISATNNAQARIISRQYSTRRILLEIETDQPCLAVIAQSFYHRWRAYVDGQPTPIWRANYAFQAFEIPPGTHRVNLIYTDGRFHFGVAISFVALGLCGVSYFRSRRN
jgi:hypothetical protein